MELIRVLQVFTIMNRGGAESMIMNYYRNIDRTKVQFDFLVHRSEKGDFDDEIKQLGGKIYKISPITFFNIKKYQKELEVFFKGHHYNIIHSHLNAISTFILKIAKQNSIPVRIAHSHTSLPLVKLKKYIYGKFSAKEMIKIIYKNIVKRNINLHSTHSFACEKNAAIWLFGKANLGNVAIINNAIDAKQFIYNFSTKNKLKTQLEINNKFIIGHVGNFSVPKNYSFIIDVFFEIQLILPESILVLVGDGELKNEIQKKTMELGLDKKVLFMGVQKNIPEILQSFDIFLFPSLYEGLPVTLIEAQASGLKCFVSNTIDNNVNFSGLINYISLEKPAKEWATIILKNKDYTRKNQYQIVIKNGYDINMNAKKLEAFYCSL